MLNNGQIKDIDDFIKEILLVFKDEKDSDWLNTTNKQLYDELYDNLEDLKTLIARLLYEPRELDLYKLVLKVAEMGACLVKLGSGRRLAESNIKIAEFIAKAKSLHSENKCIDCVYARRICTSFQPIRAFHNINPNDDFIGCSKASINELDIEEDLPFQEIEKDKQVFKENKSFIGWAYLALAPKKYSGDLIFSGHIKYNSCLILESNNVCNLFEKRVV